MEKVSAEISLEKLYNLSFGQYVGVLMRKELMRKVAKLRSRQIYELKKLLASNLDLLEVRHWSLARIDDERHEFSYYKKCTDEDKLQRIDVLDKAMPIKYENIVVVVEGENWEKRQEAVKKTFIKHLTGEEKN